MSATITHAPVTSEYSPGSESSTAFVHRPSSPPVTPGSKDNLELTLFTSAVLEVTSKEDKEVGKLNDGANIDHIKDTATVTTIHEVNEALPVSTATGTDTATQFRAQVLDDDLFIEQVVFQTPSLDSKLPIMDEEEEEEEEEDEEYPEGGFMAWRVVLGSFFGLFAVFGLINSLGAVQAYVSIHQLADKSESQVSWIFSVFLFVCYLLAGQVGPLFDAYGPYHLIIAGTVIVTLGLMTASLCTQYYQFFLSFSLCTGLGCALLMTPEIAIIGDWFKRTRATAIGAATMGGSLSGAVTPVMIRKLYSTVGYAWAIRALGFMYCASLIISICLLKPRLVRGSSHGPRSLFSLSNLVDFKAFRDKRFVWLVLANFCGELGVINGLTFFTSYALAQGKSESLSYALLAILNGVGILGRWIPGVIADRYFGRFNTLIGTTTMSFTTIFAIWLPFGHKTSGLITFAVLNGFCNGAILSLAPVCCGQICKTRDYGKRYGTMFLFASFACLLGVPLSGALIRGKNYDNLVIFNGSLYVGTTIALIVSRYYAVGRRWCKW